INRLYFGGNLKRPSNRKEFPGASVDLIYFDPPLIQTESTTSYFREPKPNYQHEFGGLIVWDLPVSDSLSILCDALEFRRFLPLYSRTKRSSISLRFLFLSQ